MVGVDSFVRRKFEACIVVNFCIILTLVLATVILREWGNRCFGEFVVLTPEAFPPMKRVKDSHPHFTHVQIHSNEYTQTGCCSDGLTLLNNFVSRFDKWCHSCGWFQVSQSI